MIGMDCFAANKSILNIGEIMLPTFLPAFAHILYYG